MISRARLPTARSSGAAGPSTASARRRYFLSVCCRPTSLKRPPLRGGGSHFTTRVTTCLEPRPSPSRSTLRRSPRKGLAHMPPVVFGAEVCDLPVVPSKFGGVCRSLHGRVKRIGQNLHHGGGQPARPGQAVGGGGNDAVAPVPSPSHLRSWEAFRERFVAAKASAIAPCAGSGDEWSWTCPSPPSAPGRPVTAGSRDSSLQTGRSGNRVERHQSGVEFGCRSIRHRPEAGARGWQLWGRLGLANSAYQGRPSEVTWRFRQVLSPVGSDFVKLSAIRIGFAFRFSLLLTAAQTKTAPGSHQRPPADELAE